MTEKFYMLKLNALELGSLMGLIEKRIESYPEDKRLFESTLRQLIEIKRAIERDCGVVKTMLPSGHLMLRDNAGNIIIRRPYSYEMETL